MSVRVNVENMLLAPFFFCWSKIIEKEREKERLRT